MIEAIVSIVMLIVVGGLCRLFYQLGYNHGREEL